MELNSDRLPPLSSRPLRFSWRSTCSRAEIGGCCSYSLVMVPAFIYGDNKSLDTSLMKLVAYCNFPFCYGLCIRRQETLFLTGSLTKNGDSRLCRNHSSG